MRERFDFARDRVETRNSKREVRLQKPLRRNATANCIAARSGDGLREVLSLLARILHLLDIETRSSYPQHACYFLSTSLSNSWLRPPRPSLSLLVITSSSCFLFPAFHSSFDALRVSLRAPEYLSALPKPLNAPWLTSLLPIALPAPSPFPPCSLHASVRRLNALRLPRDASLMDSATHPAFARPHSSAGDVLRERHLRIRRASQCASVDPLS